MSDRGGLGHYLNEAQEYLDAGNIDKSLQTANKALEIAELNEDIGSIVRAKYILSQSYYERNDKNNSLKLAMEAVKDARTSKSERHIAYANLALAKAYFLNNKSDQAEVILHDGLAKARQNKFGDIKVKMLEFSALIDSSHSGLETFEGKDDLDKSEKRNVIEQTQKQFDDDFGPGKISIDIQETEDKMDEIPSNSSQEESDLENDSIGEDPNAQLITDKSFDANITAIEDLGLGYEDYANAFESFLIESKDASPIVIGLHGEWGRGKTTLMESIQKKLDKRKFTTHWLNAWKYDNEENIWGALLNKLIESVFKDLKFFNKLFFYIRLYRYKFIIPLFIIFFLAIVVYSIFPTAITENPIFSILLLLGTTLLSFMNIVRKYGLNFKRFFGRVGDNFKLGIAGIVEKDLNNFQNIYKKYSSDTKPIIVFIDDLDRCPPQKIVMVVNAINTLTLQKGFVFFVGYDRDFVAAAISSEYGNIIKYSNEYKTDDSNFGFKFLDKIIQIPFRIPIGSRTSILAYIKDLLKIEADA
ncbi:MAG: hypothetical protein IIB94_10805, partial [Candidatus Marinimicrobia bacterium]|nr:hypothetical protein [Candidatus Neomarinimicrobiota bacterium]